MKGCQVHGAVLDGHEVTRLISPNGQMVGGGRNREAKKNLAGKGIACSSAYDYQFAKWH